jgi:hypothetical protein
MHLNKKSDLDAINRVGGAMAFIGVCRVSWLFVRNVQEAEVDGEPAEDKPDTFSMLRIKNNLAKASHTGLSYSVQLRKVKIEGKLVSEPYVVWGKVINGDADAALETKNHRQAKRADTRPSPKMQEAISFLMDALQDGESHPQNPLIDEAKKRDNIKPDTLKAAYRKLVDDEVAKRAWKVGADYVWKLVPMGDESDSVVPQQSALLAVEVAS